MAATITMSLRVLGARTEHVQRGEAVPMEPAAWSAATTFVPAPAGSAHTTVPAPVVGILAVPSRWRRTGIWRMTSRLRRGRMSSVSRQRCLSPPLHHALCRPLTLSRHCSGALPAARGPVIGYGADRRQRADWVVGGQAAVALPEVAPLSRHAVAAGRAADAVGSPLLSSMGGLFGSSPARCPMVVRVMNEDHCCVLCTTTPHRT